MIKNLTVVLSILILPFLLMIFVKLYKKHEININNKILFAVSLIPFLWGLKNWLSKDGYYIWRWFLNPYKTGIPFTASKLLAKHIYWNFVLARYAIITIILIFVILNLKKEKENKINCADFLPFNFIFIGIYQTMRNLEGFHVIMYLTNEPPILEHLEMMLKIFGLFAPLFFGILCVLITMLICFLRNCRLLNFQV